MSRPIPADSPPATAKANKVIFVIRTNLAEGFMTFLRGEIGGGLPGFFVAAGPGLGMAFRKARREDIIPREIVSKSGIFRLG